MGGWVFRLCTIVYRATFKMVEFFLLFLLFSILLLGATLSSKMVFEWTCGAYLYHY
jgi:hypothetical protein